VQVVCVLVMNVLWERSMMNKFATSVLTFVFRFLVRKLNLFHLDSSLY
jgi:hypothetical protein